VCKCSAVADVGDRLATIDMSRKLGRGSAPLGGKLHALHLTHGRGPKGQEQEWGSKWHLDPSSRLATTDIDQSKPICNAPKRPSKKSGIGGDGLKIMGCAPIGRGAGSPSNTLWPGPRPTFVGLLSGILIHPATIDMGRKVGFGVLCLFWGTWVPI